MLSASHFARQTKPPAPFLHICSPSLQSCHALASKQWVTNGTGLKVVRAWSWRFSLQFNSFSASKQLFFSVRLAFQDEPDFGPTQLLSAATS